MKLDKFDTTVLETSGNASDVMFELYGDTIGKNNAEKQMAGVRKHLRFKQSLDVGEDRKVGEMEECVIKADGSRVSKRMLIMSEEDSKDPIRVMELMGYDPLQWKLEWCKTRRNYWDVTIKNSQKVGIKHTNNAYMCEVRVTPLQNVLTTRMVSEIFDALPSIQLETYHPRKINGNLLEIQIVDPHLGMLAWHSETEGVDYDLKEAEKDIRYVINSIKQRVKQYNLKIDQIVFPIGQDYFHFDTSQGTTTKGTPLDTDSRWQKMYQTGVRILVWAVEELRKIAPVRCMYVASNHDKMLSYTATLFVRAYFRDCKDVAVDISPAPRKYIRYGKCLIGLAHGVEEGKRINDVMQVERKKDWGETDFHEWHLAHFHSKKSEEIGGVYVQYLPPIVPTDSWHKTKGYLGAIRSAKAFVWDKNEGLQLTIDVNITG